MDFNDWLGEGSINEDVADSLLARLISLGDILLDSEVLVFWGTVFDSILEEESSLWDTVLLEMDDPPVKEEPVAEGNVLTPLALSERAVFDLWIWSEDPDLPWGIEVEMIEFEPDCVDDREFHSLEALLEIVGTF